MGQTPQKMAVVLNYVCALKNNWLIIIKIINIINIKIDSNLMR